jgi:hypothetical protein
MNVEEKIEEFKQQVIPALREQTRNIAAPCRDYLGDNIAKPLSLSVESTFQDAMQHSTLEMCGILRRLDEDLKVLRGFQGTAGTSVSHFESWARYWTSVTKQMDVIRKLFHEGVVAHLPEIRQQISCYHSTQRQMVRYGALRRTVRTTAQIKVEEPPRGEVALSGRKGLLRFDPAILSATIKEPHIWTIFPDLARKSNTHFAEYIREIPLIRDMDQAIAGKIPDAQISGLKDAFITRSMNEFDRGMLAVIAQTSAHVSIRIRIYRGIIPLPASFNTAVFCTIVIVSGLVGVFVACKMPHNISGLTAGSLTALAAFIAIIFAISKSVSRKLCRLMQAELKKTISEGLSKTAQGVAEKLDVKMAEEILQQATINLSPRPLQRALAKSLE